MRAVSTLPSSVDARPAIGLPTARLLVQIRWWGAAVLVDAAIVQQWRGLGAAVERVRLRRPQAPALVVRVESREALGARVAVPWWQLLRWRCRPGDICLMRPWGLAQ